MAGGIKSVQRGVTAVSGAGPINVTISAVNLAKAFVVSNTPGSGVYLPGSASYAINRNAARLTSATNLAIAGTKDSPGVPTECFWEVVEFF